MLEEIFAGPRRVVRHASAPFALERARYLKHLKDQGYSEQTVAARASALMRVVQWLKMDAARPVTITNIEAAADRAGHHDNRPKSPRRRFIQMARDWLRFCGRLFEQSKKRGLFAELVEDFASWMADARGISAGTIERRSRCMAEFFRWCHPRRRSFREVRITDVDGFLVHAAARWSRRTMATQASDLRAFFRYAGSRGWCSPSIADVIEAPHIYEHELLPSSPTWEQVEKLIAGIPKCRPIDFRDRATFLLLAVYGLRAGEVAAIQLADLDWEHDRISIRRSKCRDVKVCPLVLTVGNAIIEYLKKGRPNSARIELFLDLVAPYRPMSPGALGQAFKRRIEKLGLPFARKGPHSLRHACATHLLGEGFSIKEIGDHLGHLSPQSTQIYAKVDLAGLRAVGNFDIGGLL